jgi:hypothetical protein
MANIAFTEVNGRPPDLDDEVDRRLYNRFYSSAALELSASLENTKYNSEARSLQVKGAYTNPDYNIDAGKAVSTLAKRVFKDVLTDIKKAMPSVDVFIPSVSSEALKKAEHERKVRSGSAYYEKLRSSLSKKVRHSSAKETATVTTPTVKGHAPVQIIPKIIDPRDLANNGKLISDDKLKCIRKGIADKSISTKEPTRLTKEQLKALIGVDVAYNLMILARDDGGYRIFAVYKGIKQKKHMAEGGYSTIKYAQDLDSGEFVAVKLQVQNTDRERIAQDKELAFQKQQGQAFGNVVYQRAKIDPEAEGKTKKGKKTHNIRDSR